MTGIKKVIALVGLLAAATFWPCHASALRSIDRVVAYIDDDAITMLELQREHKRRAAMSPREPMQQTLDALINTRLMLKAAHQSKLSIGTVDEVAILERYIELKIKASVLVSEAEIKKYYKKNKNRFKGADYNDVRPEIRKYLEEKEFNEALIKHIRELRERAAIRVLEIAE